MSHERVAARGPVVVPMVEPVAMAVEVHPDQVQPAELIQQAYPAPPQIAWQTQHGTRTNAVHPTGLDDRGQREREIVNPVSGVSVCCSLQWCGDWSSQCLGERGLLVCMLLGVGVNNSVALDHARVLSICVSRHVRS